MARSAPKQKWSSPSSSQTSSSSGDEDDRMRFESEYESSELSEMDDDSDYTPDSDDEGRDEVEDDFETYEFQHRENVWVRPKGCPEWYRGRIMKVQPSSRETRKRGPLYLVMFRRYFTNMRDNFAPREGTIRPDTPRVRALIFNNGE